MIDAKISAPYAGPLSVRVEVYMPIPRSWPKAQQFDAEMGLLRPTSRPDADNYAKMLDALNNVAWVDDSQIVDLHVSKWYNESPGMHIVIDTI